MGHAITTAMYQEQNQRLRIQTQYDTCYQLHCAASVLHEVLNQDQARVVWELYHVRFSQ